MLVVVCTNWYAHNHACFITGSEVGAEETHFANYSAAVPGMHIPSHRRNLIRGTRTKNFPLTVHKAAFLFLFEEGLYIVVGHQQL